MRRTVLFAVVVVTIFTPLACGDPGPAISEDVFVDVMIELHLVDVVRTTTDDRVALRQRVFDRYEVSEEELSQTIDYYAAATEEYSRVYGRIVDRLTEESSQTSQN